MKTTMKQYIKQQSLYTLRWETTTPIFAVTYIALAHFGLMHTAISIKANFWHFFLHSLISPSIANFFGSLGYFWIDKWIFKH